MMLWQNLILGAALLATMVSCNNRREGYENAVWLPVSYRAIVDSSGLQSGWMLTEFMLELGPPERINVSALPSEPAEFSLDLPMEFRSRIMGMGWIPPANVHEELGISEGDAAKYPRRWNSTLN